MIDRLLTEKVKAKALETGMDLVGFAPVSRWENAPYLLGPRAILPEGKTVVVGAIHITDTWTEMGGEPEPQDRSPGGWMDQNSLLDRVAYHTVRLLNDNGCKAIGVASSNIWRYRAFEGIPSLFAPDLSHIHAAAAAGLAEIGWSGLAITPEFGSRCRFISVVTDAELQPTPMYNGPKLCDMCMECVRHCPTAALKKELKEPHTVIIGGKTYRYANKNIWRCAWAEHFNLDLNSKNLKEYETVDESSILKELDEKGIRGHERGVCQKFCVPPHLRTRKPSFGRNLQIAQNRINQRYPESMPTLRKMRDDLTAFAMRIGADLTSVAQLQLDTETGRIVEKDAPGMRTVLGIAVRVPESMFDKRSDDGPLNAAFKRKIHHILLRLARMVEDYGYHAASYTGYFFTPDKTPLKLAEMSGLGKIDNDGVLKIPEFGCNVIVGAVVTDAPVDPTPSSKGCGLPAKLVKRPSALKLRSELERVAKLNLVSFMGVAPAGVFKDVVGEMRKTVDENKLGEYVKDVSLKCHGKWKSGIYNDNIRIGFPEDYVPGAKSVIVIGMHFPGELIENAGLEISKQIGTYAFHQYQTYFELCFASAEIVRILSDMGYKTAVCDDMLRIGSKVDTPRGRLPDARCNAVEAVLAGLGEIGKSGALLTAEHGPHQRRMVIVTDAELPVDVPYQGEKLCKNCGICYESCPTRAIGESFQELKAGGISIKIPIVDRLRCDWSKRYSLCPDEGPSLIGNNTKTEIPEGKISIEDIAKACESKDPVMKSRTCILETCLRKCQAGEYSGSSIKDK